MPDFAMLEKHAHRSCQYACACFSAHASHSHGGLMALYQEQGTSDG